MAFLLQWLVVENSLEEKKKKGYSSRTLLQKLGKVNHDSQPTRLVVLDCCGVCSWQPALSARSRGSEGGWGIHFCGWWLEVWLNLHHAFSNTKRRRCGQFTFKGFNNLRRHGIARFISNTKLTIPTHSPTHSPLSLPPHNQSLTPISRSSISNYPDLRNSPQHSNTHSPRSCSRSSPR